MSWNLEGLALLTSVLPPFGELENEAITKQHRAELRDEDRPGPKGSIYDPRIQLCLKETRSTARLARYVREYIPVLLEPV